MVYVISESLANLTKHPQNVIELENRNVTLKCSSDSAIEWKYDGNIVIHEGCRLGDSPTFIVSSPDPQTDCNIIALAGEDQSISGPYECREANAGYNVKSVAMVIVLGK